MRTGEREHLITGGDEDHQANVIPLICLYSRYLQFNRLLYNMNTRFTTTQENAENDLKIGYEALKKKEEETENRALEEEAQENGIMRYVSKLNEVLSQVNEKLEKDEEIDYEKRLLVELLGELKDIKIPASSIHEDIKILVKYRELIEAIVNS
ncbi:hypothetical protein G6F56_002879 [Rhizopus delemar]|nr:hypothetical protein G6F56_002879 [Rhizopus delemar]